MIGPDGRVVGHHPGEFAAEDFARVIDELESKFAGSLNRTPMPECGECNEDTGTLKFPGKVILNEGRLFIADTGHNRVLVTDLDGRIQQVIGSGRQGMDDGPADSATFYFPQGMAVDGDTLYVADTWNHAVRMEDLANGSVERIAGTGNQAMLHRRGGPARQTDLSSPWDLALGTDGTLYIAMAGNHQIWAMDTAAGTVRTFAGTGREALEDGTLTKCALAQTNGLSFAEGRLYFADAESSAIRVADITADMVKTYVGQGLFDFGDRDGPGEFALLQHTLGVSYSMGELYVTDTYNNKIKRINPVTADCETILGSGEAVLRDGVGAGASFWEPGGLSVHEDKIYIADTNNHAIRVADISGRDVSTLSIR
jgi:sugar lactone lactonase YvrE